MDNSTNFMFQLPNSQDPLTQFRRKKYQEHPILQNQQDINPQYFPPEITRRKRKQRKDHSTTVIKIKPLQQIDPQQKKEAPQPQILTQQIQSSIICQKVQESFEENYKSPKDHQNMSTSETKHLETGQVLQYNSSSEQQNEQYFQKIQKIQENSKKYDKKSSFKAGSLQVLINMQIPQKYAIKILLKRSKNLFSSTVIDLYLQQDKKLLLRAIKSPMPFSGHFQIIDPLTKISLGQVIKNFTGTQYILVCEDSQKKKKEKLWISYRMNIFGIAGQNTINILRCTRQIDKTDKFSDIKTYWQNGNRKKIQTFSNKLAIKKNGNYQLDFHGMVSTPSSKNFIIDDQNGVQCLLFGKRRDDIFAMNVSHPLSILQAFAMGISSIDGKLLVH